MKKKILLVSCEGLGRGGIQAVMMNILRSLHKEYDFDALLFTEDVRAYDEEFLSYGGKIIRIPFYRGNNSLLSRADYYIRGFPLYLKIKKALQENGPYEAIHCNNHFESAVCLKAAAEQKIPVRIAHSHALHFSNNIVDAALNHMYQRIISKYGTDFIGCSQEACENLFGRENHSWRVVCNPYNDVRIQFHENKNLDHLCITQIGRYGDLKNQRFTLEVLFYISQKYPDSEVNYVGFDGKDYMEQLKRDAERLHLTSQVNYYPADTNISELFENTSYLMLPSTSEGFGIVLIEAQAAGVTCFASTAVPKTTNCGGCYYLDLSCGAEYWAEQMINHYEKNHGKHCLFDCKKYTNDAVMNCYRRIYEGRCAV